MQPSPLEAPQTDPAVQAAVTAARAVVENAKALGLVWNLRPATVFVDSPDPTLVGVTMDGDTAVVDVVSLIGPLGARARVMVLIVPPAGMFIIGQPTTGPKSSYYDAASNADLALTIAVVPIPATLITVPVRLGQKWEASGVFDFSLTATGIGVAVGYLLVGGVAQTRAAIYTNNTTGRSTVPQNWSGTVAATGDLTFQLAVQKTVNAGAVSAMGTHTTLEVEINSAGGVYP
jgi:hypothetical protein